jgi:hypothetical protein
MRFTLISLVLVFAGCSRGGPVTQRLHAEAESLHGFVSSQAGRSFLSAVRHLPEFTGRTLYRDDERNYCNAQQHKALQPAQRSRFEPVEVSGEYYYYTRYGTPLAYARALDQLEWDTFNGKRILDFGYGGIGHLRMLAALGADVVGVEVDSMLKALYSAENDQGVIRGSAFCRGKLRLVHGRFPAKDIVRASVGQGYDLIISKNVLKRGYIHPEREVDPRMLVDLGVDDAAFIEALNIALRPGGMVMIYNLSPAPNKPDAPYKPWADGRCPFDQRLLEASGFEVLEYDYDDTIAARRMARRLGWDNDGMDIDSDLFGHFTLMRKTR